MMLEKNALQRVERSRIAELGEGNRNLLTPAITAGGRSRFSADAVALILGIDVVGGIKAPNQNRHQPHILERREIDPVSTEVAGEVRVFADRGDRHVRQRLAE